MPKKKGKIYVMKEKMSKLTLMLVIIMIAASIGACGGETAKTGDGANAAKTSDKPIVLKFAHALATTTPYQTGAEWFKKELETRTNGRIVVEIYPNGQLGAERDLFEGLKLGTVEIAVGGMGVLAQTYDSRLNVFGLPFIFSTRDEVYKVLDGPVGAEMFAPLKSNGVEIVGNFEAGFRQVSNNKRAVNSVEDVKGLKIRTPEGAVYLDTWNALGASPTPIAWTELFGAMQTGVIDGAEVPISNFASSGFGEVQKHYAWINYMYDPIPMVASSAFLNSLPPDLQQIVRDVCKEACSFERKTVANMEAQLQKDLEAKGMTFTNPDLAGFQQAVQPIYSNYQDQESLKKVLSALGR
jgi:tripartite ATP-independent transporter DctP family solute receptor